MTSLSSIPDHQLSITCGLCKHHSMLEVANLIAVVVNMQQPTMYVKSIAALSVKPKVTTLIRLSTEVTQMWRLMVLR